MWTGQMKFLDRLWARIGSTYVICKEADFGLRLALEPKDTGDADKRISCNNDVLSKMSDVM